MYSCAPRKEKESLLCTTPLLNRLKMVNYPMISAVLSVLAIHHVTSQLCKFSEFTVRPQSEVDANWNEDVPEEWTDFWDCSVRGRFTDTG